MAKYNKSKRVENSKVEEKKKGKNIMSKVKSALNNPLPMLIALTIIIVILLIYISTTNRESKIYVGEINEEDVNIVNIH